MGAIGRFFVFVVRTALLLAAAGFAIAAVAELDADDGTGDPIRYLIGAAVLLGIRSLVARMKGPGRLGAPTVPATIMRIWQDPRPGAPAIYWTYVLFDARGERVKVRLSKSQARTFLDRYSAGDVGQLTHRGETLLAWQPPTVTTPIRKTQVSAFISYERSWSDDAQYVATFLRSRGIDVWLDTDELRAGEKLTGKVVDALSSADVFVPLLSATYWTSRWCLKELELAQSWGVPIRPVKVEGGRLVAPPHLRNEVAPLLDDAVFVDLRGRDPIVQLEDFTTSLATTR